MLRNVFLHLLASYNFLIFASTCTLSPLPLIQTPLALVSQLQKVIHVGHVPATRLGARGWGGAEAVECVPSGESEHHHYEQLGAVCHGGQHEQVSQGNLRSV